MDYGAMLKTKGNNPNRRSAHYTRQAEFSGSDRQIRGAILAQLVRRDGLDEEDLVMRTARDEPARARRLIDRLIAEGFLERTGSGIRIREA